MKKILFSSFVFIAVVTACSKGSDSPGDDNNNNTSIQKQIVNTKWYYDSTVIWHIGDGFLDVLDYNGYNSKSYIYFREDSIMTEYHWTGIMYEQTDYPYVWNGDMLVCYYDATEDALSTQIKNNQLIFGEVSTSPRKTDTSGLSDLFWWYYHK